MLNYMDYSAKHIILSILLVIIIVMNLNVQYNTDFIHPNIWIGFIIIMIIYLFIQDTILGILGLLAGYTMLSNIIQAKTTISDVEVIPSTNDNCPDNEPVLSQFPVSLEEEIVNGLKITNPYKVLTYN
jgi:hypothetical protein